MTALKDKTVILVTHQVEFLTGADRILLKNLHKSFFAQQNIYRLVFNP